VKAIRVEEHGGLEALRYVDVPDPEPAADQVLIEVRASGVNHLDVWVRRGVPGYTFPLPLTPGNDVAGVVLAVGERVRGVAPGDAVVVQPGVSCGRCAACLGGADHRCPRYCILGEHCDGGWAERLVVPGANVFAKPDDLSFVEAASMPLTFLTAWHMLVDRAELRPGEVVLVQAAGSGVSSAAIQIAKLWGASVIATAASAAKLERARALGADHTIDYEREDVPARVRALTDRAGADVVIDHVGAATWEASTKALAWHGRLVTCGATTGAGVELNLAHLFFKAQSLLGSTMGSKAEVLEVFRHAAAGRLRPVVDAVLPLSEAREAQRRLEAREVFGKLVLVPDGKETA